MNNREFRIKSYKDYRTLNKIGFLVGIFLFSLMAFIKYYDGNWDLLSYLFVLLVLVYTLRLFFPNKCLKKVYISIIDYEIRYQLTGFSLKPRKIDIRHIQSVSVFESAIFLKVRGLEIRLSLIPFSDELKNEIGIYFKELRTEIENA